MHIPRRLARDYKIRRAPLHMLRVLRTPNRAIVGSGAVAAQDPNGQARGFANDLKLLT